MMVFNDITELKEALSQFIEEEILEIVTERLGPGRAAGSQVKDLHQLASTWAKAYAEVCKNR